MSSRGAFLRLLLFVRILRLRLSFVRRTLRLRLLLSRFVRRPRFYLKPIRRLGLGLRLRFRRRNLSLIRGLRPRLKIDEWVVKWRTTNTKKERCYISMIIQQQTQGLGWGGAE